MHHRDTEITELVQLWSKSLFLPACSVPSALGTSSGFDWLRFPSRLCVGNMPQLPLSAVVMTFATCRKLASFGRMARDRGLKGRVGSRLRVRNEANRQSRGHGPETGAVMQNEANSLARGSALTDGCGRVYVSSPALGGVENKANWGPEGYEDNALRRH